MKYRITCHRRAIDTITQGPMRGHNFKLMEPISFNADTLAEMRAAILKAQGTRFAYRVTVSCYLAAFENHGDRKPSGVQFDQWVEVNP